MKNLSFLLILVFSSLLFYCEEKIPEGPPRVEVAEAELYVPFDRSIFPQPTNYGNRYLRPENMTQEEWDYATDSAVRFRIKVNNIFDETIDGLKWIDVKLHLWSTNYLHIDQHLHYRNFSEDTTLIVLHPDKSYYVFTKDSLIWDQEDEPGTSIHQTNPYQTFFVRLDSVFNRDESIWEYFCDTTYTSWVDTVVAFDLPIRMKAQAEVKIFKNYEAILSNIFHFEIQYYFPDGMKDAHECVIDGGGK